jgi:hypothetical protein
VVKLRKKYLTAHRSLLIAHRSNLSAITYIYLLMKHFLLLLSAFALAACVANAPAPGTSPEPVTDQDTPEQTGSEKSTLGQPAKAQALDSYRLATPETVPSTEPVQQSSIDVVPVSEKGKDAQAQAPVDPYKAFPSLAEGVFAYADALYKAGFADSAVAYLQRFRVIKPLWAQWEAKTDSMIFAFDKVRAERAKRFEPLVLEIQNMNRARAAYSMVAETADSLIALAPDDSLTRWAIEQKQVAYKNTLAKAKKEYAEIKSLADDKAQFAEAQKKVTEFQMRYRDFEAELQIQALVDHIRELAQATDAAAAKYWESHDPAEALAKADEFIKAGKYKDAKELLNKLKASKLRKEANAKYHELADAFCNTQRKETSNLFAKAQKQKDPDKKRELLKQAIAPLDKCMSEYPDNSQKKTVVENRQFLEKEIQK